MSFDIASSFVIIFKCYCYLGINYTYIQLHILIFLGNLWLKKTLSFWDMKRKSDKLVWFKLVKHDKSQQ